MSLLATHARLSALASVLPTVEVLSSYWDQHYGFPPGTIERRTGIRRRFRCGANENARTLACAAIREVLRPAALHPADVGLVIDASACIQQPLPGNAACLLEELGPEWAGVPGIDVRNTCLGFLAALHVAQSLVAVHRHIIVVCAETPWAGLRNEDPETAPLFGEGAAAAVVSWSPRPRPYYYAMQTFAVHRDACQVLGGGHRLPPFDHRPENDSLYRFAMDGPRLHKIASRHLPPMLQTFRRQWTLGTDDWWIPHPASGPAVELMRRRLSIPPGRFFCTLPDHGNIIAAGIPHQLAQARTRGLAGSFIAVGTAAGYSQAVMAWRDSDAP